TGTSLPSAVAARDPASEWIHHTHDAVWPPRDEGENDNSSEELQRRARLDERENTIGPDVSEHNLIQEEDEDEEFVVRDDDEPESARASDGWDLLSAGGFSGYGEPWSPEEGQMRDWSALRGDLHYTTLECTVAPFSHWRFVPYTADKVCVGFGH
ncbi:hypothetical protein FOL46_004207, partial [Perkinsus olseni]